MSRAGPGSRGPRGRGGSSSGSGIAIRGPPSALGNHSSSSSSTTASPASSRGRPASTSSNNLNTSSASSSTLHSTGIIGHKDKSGRIVSYTSPDDKCPSCKTDRFLNPKLKLLVSPCYHKLCTSCIDRIWSLGPAPCPTCGTVCRKNQFGQQTFQDLGVEREVDLRKRIQKSYNKPPEEFKSLQEYNDYLEEIELITFNLINRVDYEATLAKLIAYENANRSSSTRLNTQSEQSSTTQASLESQISRLRKARVEKRKGYEAEDLRCKREEEDEIVLALEDGLEEEDIVAIQTKWKEKREQRELQRDREEEEALQQEESIRRSIEDVKKGVVQPDAQQSSKGGTSASSWNPQCLQSFTGPLASLSNGLELFVDPKTKQEITLLPPPRLAFNSAGNPAGRPPPSTLSPYDPWTQPILDKMPGSEIDMLKAGGYDWCENWRWDLSIANGSLAVMAPSVGDQTQQG